MNLLGTSLRLEIDRRGGSGKPPSMGIESEPKAPYCERRTASNYIKVEAKERQTCLR